MGGIKASHFELKYQMMGFSSWLTQDTNRSISNMYSSKPVFTFYMLDNQGNVWKEDCYEGYCMIGGKDYFELLAEMNNFTDRKVGIRLYFEDTDKYIIYPNLVENLKGWTWVNEKPMQCPHQGYFY